MREAGALSGSARLSPWRRRGSLAAVVDIGVPIRTTRPLWRGGTGGVSDLAGRCACPCRSIRGGHHPLPPAVRADRRDGRIALRSRRTRSSQSFRMRQRGRPREERPCSAVTHPPWHTGPACAQRGASPRSMLFEGTGAADHCIFPESRPADPALRKRGGATDSAPEKITGKMEIPTSGSRSYCKDATPGRLSHLLEA